MPLPLAHALVGASISVTISVTIGGTTGRTTGGTLRPTHASVRRGLIVGALLGVLPDVDFALGWLHVVRWSHHHGVTHSIAFAIVAGLLAARVSGLRPLACMLAALSHPALDYVITESAGVALWWPVTTQREKLGIDALSYYHVGHGSLATLIAIELAIFGPIFALAVTAACRTPASRTANSRSW
ncbi:MAG TPA: metal-dependent hydrolase [Kofleriaceae bacterium]|nr:metal-dependent hydrolase [Kofleriaceae bacterium]